MSFHSVDPTSGELWQIAGLKNTAANLIPYSNTISGLRSNKVQGAIDELAAQNQTLETSLNGKINTTDIANNLTTTTAGKVLDARQGKALNDAISNSVLYFSGQACSALTGDFCTISNANITANHVVAEAVFANSSAITTDVTWTTASGSLKLNGTCSTATTVNIVLVKKNN